MFSTSTKSDPHIRKAIALASKKTGLSEPELEAEIDKKMEEIEGLQKISPILYDTIADNLVESETFNLLEKHKVSIEGAPKFSTVMFYKLFRRIRAENDSLFPLRNFIDHKALDPRIVFVPDPREKRFASVDTAAATPAGEFIFNLDFMQRLLDFAHLKGVQPKGKKYENSGGDIPPEWVYIEFLIKHELYHYTYADSHYKKILKADSQIINWVGDFRSNHDLVKSGIDQLPIGLYSKHVNYHKQRTYKEMYDLVKSEMDKLPKSMADKVKDLIGEMSGDEHPDGDGDVDDKTADDIEGNETDVRGKAPGKDIGSESEVPTPKGTPKQSSQPGGRGGGGNGSGSVDYTKFRPKKTWKEILKKLVHTDSANVDTTYQRPHRRNVTNVHIAAQIGAGAIKPAEIPVTNRAIKLLIVEDSSGSMSSAIGQIHAEIANLVKTSGRDIAEFAMIKFSGSHECYVCDLKSSGGTYHKVESYSTMKKVGESKPFEDLLKVHFGSSTNFDATVTNDAEILLNKGYNMLLISDSDVCGGENLAQLAKVYGKYKKQVFAIMASRGDFTRLISSLKEISANVTYFE